MAQPTRKGNTRLAGPPMEPGPNNDVWVAMKPRSIVKATCYSPYFSPCVASISMSAAPAVAPHTAGSHLNAITAGVWAHALAGALQLQRIFSTPDHEQQKRAQAATLSKPKTVARKETEAIKPATAAAATVKDPLQSLKLLFAGAMSAVVSRTAVAPMERVKMELVLAQGAGGAVATAQQVMRTEGVPGFWKGNALNVLRTAPFKAVNFFSFDTYHRVLSQLSGRDGNVERFLAGALAGVTATLVCFPLDVVRTRLMSRSHGARYGPGPFRNLAGMLRHEGPHALYTGCLPAVIGMAPAGAVFYGVYDLLKAKHLAAMVEAHTASGGAPSSAPTHITPLYTLMYGAVAGAASEVIVYPLEVVRRRMQIASMVTAGTAVAGHAAGHAGAAAAGAMSAAAHHTAAAAIAHHGRASAAAAAGSAAIVLPVGGGAFARVLAVCSHILATSGPRGFYAGLAPNMLQVLPSAALSYYTYDTIKQLLCEQRPA